MSDAPTGAVLVSTLATEYPSDDKLRILSLDGTGGRVAFYTIAKSAA